MKKTLMVMVSDLRDIAGFIAIMGVFLAALFGPLVLAERFGMGFLWLYLYFPALILLAWYDNASGRANP